MRKCANCGNNYSENLDSCPECGSEEIRVEMERGLRCPNCKEVNPRARSS